MKQLVAAFFLGAAVAVSPMAATAQSISRILSNSGLSPEDFNLMGAAGRSLYDTAQPRVGQTAAWENPATKSHGTVELSHWANNCAGLRHLFHARGAETARDIRTRYCKTAEGKWVLQP